jgi:hypothetical protein
MCKCVFQLIFSGLFRDCILCMVVFIIVALFNVLIYFVLSVNTAGYLRLTTMII